jgi:hypothetical protein
VHPDAFFGFTSLSEDADIIVHIRPFPMCKAPPSDLLPESRLFWYREQMLSVWWKRDGNTFYLDGVYYDSYDGTFHRFTHPNHAGILLGSILGFKVGLK